MPTYTVSTMVFFFVLPLVVVVLEIIRVQSLAFGSCLRRLNSNLASVVCSPSRFLSSSINDGIGI